MTKKVMDALGKLNKRLNNSVVPQLEAIINLISQTAIDIAEESDLNDEELESYIQFSKVMMGVMLKVNTAQK